LKGTEGHNLKPELLLKNNKTHNWGDWKCGGENKGKSHRKTNSEGGNRSRGARM